MNTDIEAKEHSYRAAHAETIVKDLENLARCGFISQEIASLLWLQNWYQTEGSDRIELLHHWEFLKLLVLNGKLDV